MDRKPPQIPVFCELVEKIESHPHRQYLQGDLQQSNAYNPFSEISKKMLQDMEM